jgi:ParB family chromosome partitioning protein
MFEIASIPIQQIDLQTIDLEDRLYQISDQKDLRLLCQSIQNMGLMHPPIFQAVDLKYRIVSGFMRVFACQEMGMKHIPGRVLKSDVSEHDCAKWAVTDNAIQRNLSPLEQSRALALIEKTMPDHMTLQVLAQQMGLPSTDKAIHQIRQLCQMPEFIQLGIANEYIAIPIARELIQFSETDALQFVKILKRLNPGLNIQRELLITCDEIAKRDNTTITDLLCSDDVTSILTHFSDDRKLCIHNLREHFKRLRYPNFTTIKHQVESGIKQLKLNKQTKLIPPPYFESNAWILQITFKDIGELADCLSGVISKTKGIKKIIEQDIQL